jgi:nucleotide-binding universal stress UspA family protein
MQVRKILIPVSGEEADDEAIRLACTLGKQHKCEIYVVYVITIQRALPVEMELKPETEKAEQVLAHIKELAEVQSQRIQSSILQTREAGQAIIDAAKAYGADLILIGSRHMERFGRFNLGSTIPYILKNAPCRVILYQQHTPTLKED